MPAEGRRERHRREVFERLLEAATQLMFLRAVDDATVQEITDIADVGKGTFFNYFRSKEYVFPEIARRTSQRLEAAIQKVIEGEISARQVLVDLLTVPTSKGGDWRTFYGSVLRSITNDDDVRVTMAVAVNDVADQLVRVVALGRERGEFRADLDASALGLAVHRLWFGVGLVAWINGSIPSAPENAALSRLALDLLLGGPQAPPGRKRSPTRRSQPSRRSR